MRRSGDRGDTTTLPRPGGAWLAWASIALGLGLLAPGCDRGDGRCSTFPPIAAGIYRSQGGTLNNPSVAYSAVALAKELTVDYQHGTVSISYTLDGRQVVERYRIRRASGPLPPDYRQPTQDAEVEPGDADSGTD